MFAIFLLIKETLTQKTNFFTLINKMRHKFSAKWTQTRISAIHPIRYCAPESCTKFVKHMNEYKVSKITNSLKYSPLVSAVSVIGSKPKAAT